MRGSSACNGVQQWPQGRNNAVGRGIAWESWGGGKVTHGGPHARYFQVHFSTSIVSQSSSGHQAGNCMWGGVASGGGREYTRWVQWREL